MSILVAFINRDEYSVVGIMRMLSRMVLFGRAPLALLCSTCRTLEGSWSIVAEHWLSVSFGGSGTFRDVDGAVIGRPISMLRDDESD